ncbi:hypothetical protein [Bradyrhizobium guangzhouense]|uniref:Uncharacterized protein n=1 Tax=Bradyrhizobium guangzhouense TaxID=1325095 RepID=A0AAE6C6N9_9BRAD|nr:hypothetical protein [Bradyrhizobium guangzhouense]QAU44813.1 hypothetical protein XH91_05250 [Bradyrhizobium guangzhouense]RXH13881.1 hypothetical protein EAS54_22525 [Bradyrhizobium guangzhouense]
MILKFPNTAAREDFLSRMKGVAVANIRLKPSFAQPTVVIVKTSGDVTENRLRSELSRYLDGSVKIFQDVEFRPLG